MWPPLSAATIISFFVARSSTWNSRSYPGKCHKGGLGSGPWPPQDRSRNRDGVESLMTGETADELGDLAVGAVTATNVIIEVPSVI